MGLNIIELSSFESSRGQIDSSYHKQIDGTVEKFKRNPELLGLHDEKLHGKHGWRSLRVNDDLRIIYHRQNGDAYLAHVCHHQPAYRWVENHEFRKDIDDGIKILDIKTEVETRKRVVYEPKTLIFGHCAPEFLLSIGVPETLLNYIKTEVTEEEFPNLIGQVDEQVWYNLDDLRLNKIPRCLVQQMQDATGKQTMRLWVAGQHTAVRNAIAGNFNRWAIFLHPEQRQIVERQFAGSARVYGPAGCGKSIVGLYRAVHLT